jgi:amino acid transporter
MMFPPYDDDARIFFYSTALAIYITGGRVFWRTNMLLAVVSLVIVVIYCLGSLKFVNFSENAGYVSQQIYDTSDCSRVSLIRQEWFVGGLRGFMKSFPLAAWFYVGIESVNFACDDVSKVHKCAHTHGGS